MIAYILGTAAVAVAGYLIVKVGSWSEEDDRSL